MVTILTVVFAAAAIIVAYLPAKPLTAQLFDLFTSLVKIGFGAICGLLGAKAAEAQAH